MTQPIHLIAEVYAVEVPDPANAIISGNVITWKNSQAQGRGFIALPAGNWQLICTTKEVKVSDMVQVVEGIDSEGFKNYQNGMYVFCSPVSSFRSLLTSKGLDPNKNYVLIKKVS